MIFPGVVSGFPTVKKDELTSLTEQYINCHFIILLLGCKPENGGTASEMRRQHLLKLKCNNLLVNEHTQRPTPYHGYTMRYRFSGSHPTAIGTLLPTGNAVDFL